MAVYDPLGLEEAPPARARTIDQAGNPVDAVAAARDSIDVMALVTRLQACGLGQELMTMPEIRAAETLLNRLMAAAAQRVDIAAVIEVRDKRRLIDQMVEDLLRPGAVQRSPQGTPLLHLPTLISEARTARADGAGPPEGVDIDVVSAEASDRS